jgi:hypothetical protein
MYIDDNVGTPTSLTGSSTFSSTILIALSLPSLVKSYPRCALRLWDRISNLDAVGPHYLPIPEKKLEAHYYTRNCSTVPVLYVLVGLFCRTTNVTKFVG